MFIGRRNELQLLEDSIKKSGSATLVYGVRKVGKTTLIKEAISRSEKKLLYFECEKTSLAENLNSFTDEMVRPELTLANRNFKFQLSPFS